jgi:hypothetical protein
LTTIAASHLLSITTIYDGFDGGLPYLTAAVDMAKRMDLLGSSGSRAAWEGQGKKPDHWMRASSHIAWGTFNWIM